MPARKGGSLELIIVWKASFAAPKVRGGKGLQLRCEPPTDLSGGGIDLHSNNAVVAVIDDQDRVLYCKRLTNDLQLIMAALEPHRDELQGESWRLRFMDAPELCTVGRSF
ncbi:hypothetical protein OKW41_003437 [Paraburkholderia sp. UCT70]